MKVPPEPVDKPYVQMSPEELERAVRYHNYLYFVKNAPEISDYRFDRMVERLRQLKPDSEVLAEIPSESEGERPKVRHTSAMLSLEKAYSAEEVLKWAEKFEGPMVASPKVDGLAIELRYGSDGRLELAATRGDGLQGDLITENARMVEGIPGEVAGGPAEIRGEVYMQLSVFQKRFRDQFANPRNLAAGAIKQKDPRRTRDYHLSFFAYELRGTDILSEWDKFQQLKKWQFPIVEVKKVERDRIDQTYRYFLERRDRYDFETDGIVFRCDRVAEQERLGATAHHPRASIAYKFQGESGTTVLQDVEWSVARSQVITPIGIVKPVELSGATVSRVSLHNYGLMKEKDLRKGSEVVVVRRGGVIPYLEAVTKRGNGAPFGAPKKCPSCGMPTEVREEFLYCTNKKGCRETKISELRHFVETVEIDGFGPKLLARLYDNGFVTDAAEFYDLTKENLLEIERMGEVLATKLIRNIQEKRTIDLATFLTALGIREVGRQVARLLASHFGTFRKLQQAGEAELTAIETIGPIIAQELVRGFTKQRKLIDKLLARIRLREGAGERPKGKLAGKKFCFTGGMAAMPRSEGQKRVEALGGEVVDSITKDLDYLVVGSEGGAGSKLVKAEKYVKEGEQLKIITEEDFLRMIGEKSP